MMLVDENHKYIVVPIIILQKGGRGDRTTISHN